VKRSIALLTGADVWASLLSGCSGNDDDTHKASSAEQSGQTDIPDAVPVPESAPAVPEMDELSRRGFECRELPPDGRDIDGGHATWLDDQSDQLCLLSDGVVMAVWTMTQYDGHVLSWDYVAWPPTETPVNAVTLSQMKALQTVFDTLLPQDFAVLGPAMEEWTTPKDTATWDFEGSGHVSVGGPGMMDFSAVLVDKPLGLSLSDRPKVVGPEVDPQKFLDAAEDVGWTSCEGEDRGDYWGYDITCDFDDLRLSMTIDTDGTVQGLSVTNYGAKPDAMVRDLATVAEQAGADGLADVANHLAATKGTKETLAWVAGLPAIIKPPGHPDGLNVEAGVVSISPS